MSKSLKINLILLGLAILILVGKIYNLPTAEVKAQTPTAISYGVSMNNNTGYLTGFAWSENIGWIKFMNYVISNVKTLSCCNIF